MAEPCGPDGVDERYGHVEAERSRVTHHLEVAGQRRLIDLVGPRFHARPLDGETHPIKSEIRDEVENRLVVTPEVVSGAGAGVSTKSDCRRITRRGFADAVEPTLDRVPLQGHEESSASGHALSFARLCTTLLH